MCVYNARPSLGASRATLTTSRSKVGRGRREVRPISTTPILKRNPADLAEPCQIRSGDASLDYKIGAGDTNPPPCITRLPASRPPPLIGFRGRARGRDAPDTPLNATSWQPNTLRRGLQAHTKRCAAPQADLRPSGSALREGRAESLWERRSFLRFLWMLSICALVGSNTRS